MPEAEVALVDSRPATAQKVERTHVKAIGCRTVKLFRAGMQGVVVKGRFSLPSNHNTATQATNVQVFDVY